MVIKIENNLCEFLSPNSQIYPTHFYFGEDRRENQFIERYLQITTKTVCK